MLSNSFQRIDASNAVRILLYIAVLTVYTPLIPVSIETQPLFFFLAFSLVVLVIKPSGQLPVRRLTIYFFFLAIFLHSLASVFLFGLTSVVQAIKYFLPLFVCLIPVRFFRSPSIAVQNSVALVHVALAVLYLFGLAGFIGEFYGRYTSDTASSRGFSFLAYEPSYASTYLFTLFFISRFGNHLDSERAIFAEIVFILCILLTKSFLGVIFVLLALMTYAGASVKRFLPFLLLLLGLIVFGYIFSGTNNRVLEIAEALSSLDASDFFTSFVILEPSGTSRLLVNVSSLFEVFNSPLGHGVGSFGSVWPEVASNTNKDIFEKNILILDFLKEGKASPQSYIACLTFETGVLGIVFFVFASSNIYRNCRKNNKINWVLIGYFLMYVLVQSQTSNPIFIFTMVLMAKSFNKMHQSARSIARLCTVEQS